MSNQEIGTQVLGSLVALFAQKRITFPNLPVPYIFGTRGLVKLPDILATWSLVPNI